MARGVVGAAVCVRSRCHDVGEVRRHPATQILAFAGMMSVVVILREPFERLARNPLRQRGSSCER
jgi:hypothetical protein